ncbi:hypothetical protein BCR44DRAFT_1443717, partial [Catenaria anguillulae PL171]
MIRTTKTDLLFSTVLHLPDPHGSLGAYPRALSAGLQLQVQPLQQKPALNWMLMSLHPRLQPLANTNASPPAPLLALLLAQSLKGMCLLTTIRIPTTHLHPLHLLLLRLVPHNCHPRHPHPPHHPVVFVIVMIPFHPLQEPQMPIIPPCRRHRHRTDPTLDPRLVPTI